MIQRGADSSFFFPIDDEASNIFLHEGRSKKALVARKGHGGRLNHEHARKVRAGPACPPADEQPALQHQRAELQRLQHVEPEPGWLQFVQLQQLQPGTG